MARAWDQGATRSVLASTLVADGFFDDSNIGFLFYDAADRVVDANEAAARMFELSVEGIVGMSVMDETVRVVRRHGSPYVLSELLNSIAEVVRGERDDEIIGLDRVGHPRKWLRVGTHLVSQGGPQDVLATLVDVTPQVERSNMLQLLSSVGPLVASAPGGAVLLRGSLENADRVAW